MTGLRERLKAKRVREETFTFVTGDVEPAQAKLAQLKRDQILYTAGRKSDDPEAVKYQQAIEEAQAELDACSEKIVLRGLTAADWEALVQAHPRQEDDHPDAQTHDESFYPALLEATVVTPPGEEAMTADDWKAELESDRWSAADRAELQQMAQRVCIRPFSEIIPKG